MSWARAPSAIRPRLWGTPCAVYRAFVLPGIDMLCDFHRKYTTAKQTASIVHQNGAEGMLSELYGVTGWDYDFRGYKLQGDWQAALGVTVRVPHLAWMTMKGEAKRDYPASISYQSPWAEEFSMIEDHFARLNTALTRGKPVVRVAVVHPIESYWLAWGPQDGRRPFSGRKMDRQFKELAETFLFHTIDFDYLCEAELPSFCEKGGNPLKVGKMAYDTIIVPPVLTLRSSTVQLLSAFVKEGGKLFFLGSCPAYVDACPSKVVEPLYQISRHLDFLGKRPPLRSGGRSFSGCPPKRRPAGEPAASPASPGKRTRESLALRLHGKESGPLRTSILLHGSASF